MDLKDVKIGVLGGGVSGEREVSLVSSKGVYDALLRRGMKAVLIDIVTDDEPKVKRQLTDAKIGFAFIVLHGEFGEDGKIQKILEDLNMPYTGCGAKASYLAMDKIASKELFLKHGVSTPKYAVCLRREDNVPLQYPVVVKPFFAGSSLGVSIVKSPLDLPVALADALKYTGHKALVEDYIDGRELTIGILDDKPLEVVEIAPRKGFYDFNNKYGDDLTDFIAPAPLDQATREKLRDLALQAHKALGCRQYSRVDVRLNSKNEAYVLEVNTIPGMTSHSLLPLSAKCCGIDFDTLVLTIARSAWEARGN